MWQAIGQLLPIAIAAALSTIPIMATILILVSDRRDEAATPYVVGWVLGTTVFVTLATLMAQSLPPNRPRAEANVIGVLELVVGGALVVTGLFALRHRHSERTTRMPRWLTKVDSLESGPALGLGVVLNLRPKALLLVAAAGLVLRGASLAPEETALAIVVFTVVATSTVVVPVVLTFLSPTRMGPRLGAAREWLTGNGATLTAVTMLGIGCLLLAAGATDI
jgi:hypothetical protein